MEEILHQLIGSLSMFIPLFTRFFTSQVVSRISEPSTVCLAMSFSGTAKWQWQYKWLCPNLRPQAAITVPNPMMYGNVWCWAIVVGGCCLNLGESPNRLTLYCFFFCGGGSATFSIRLGSSTLAKQTPETYLETDLRNRPRNRPLNLNCVR